ncbi:MAG: putative lipoprotein [Bryobacterales bacterium]|nr:putative lipoprotein [Bryobacterales bacterium]
MPDPTPAYTSRVVFDQADYDLRCEWGLSGLLALGSISDVAVIVDILSFSTAVDVAVARGACVFPYRWNDESACAFATERGALLASSRSPQGYSLSPVSLRSIPPDVAIVLPSPNGSALSLQSQAPVTFTACLRNCEAVAERICSYGRKVAVIAAGEQWPDGTIRPCVEDLIGAGALIACLPGRRSPEADLAVAVFDRFRGDLSGTLSRCSSGKELIERGFAEDIAMASDYSSSRAIPILQVDRFVNEATYRCTA